MCSSRASRPSGSTTSRLLSSSLAPTPSQSSSSAFPAPHILQPRSSCRPCSLLARIPGLDRPTARSSSPFCWLQTRRIRGAWVSWLTSTAWIRCFKVRAILLHDPLHVCCCLRLEGDHERIAWPLARGRALSTHVSSTCVSLTSLHFVQRSPTTVGGTRPVPKRRSALRTSSTPFARACCCPRIKRAFGRCVGEQPVSRSGDCCALSQPFHVLGDCSVSTLALIPFSPPLSTLTRITLHFWSPERRP